MKILAQILMTGGFLLLIIHMVYYWGNGLFPESKEEFFSELLLIALIAIGYFLNKKFVKEEEKEI